MWVSHLRKRGRTPLAHDIIEDCIYIKFEITASMSDWEKKRLEKSEFNTLSELGSHLREQHPAPDGFTKVWTGRRSEGVPEIAILRYPAPVLNTNLDDAKRLVREVGTVVISRQMFREIVPDTYKWLAVVLVDDDLILEKDPTYVKNQDGSSTTFRRLVCDPKRNKRLARSRVRKEEKSKKTGKVPLDALRHMSSLLFKACEAEISSKLNKFLSRRSSDYSLRVQTWLDWRKHSSKTRDNYMDEVMFLHDMVKALGKPGVVLTDEFTEHYSKCAPFVDGLLQSDVDLRVRFAQWLTTAQNPPPPDKPQIKTRLLDL